MISAAKKVKVNRVTNYMEELADGVLGSLLSKERARFTEDAIQDIKALALNRLWPMYVTTTVGRDFIKKVISEDKIEKDVIRELRAAMDIVRTNPRSGKK